MSRVYIGGLAPDVQQRDVEDAFYKFGKLLNVWVARKPPGFAFLVRTHGVLCVASRRTPHFWGVPLLLLSTTR